MLSFVIPTLNRKAFLPETLSHLMPQVARATVPVEVVISDNCSDEPLDEVIKPYPGLRIVRWDERVDIERSFERSVPLASHPFVCLFGDDDIALPGYVDEIVSCLMRPDAAAIGCIYTNRLIGDSTLNVTREIAHTGNPYGVSIMEPADFIEEFNHQPGFVTSLIFSKEVWDAGIAGYLPEFQGYSFLSRVYSGMSGRKAAYLRAPLVIQRRGVQTWKADWPDFWLISMAGLLHRLDRVGVTRTALDHWRHDEVTLKGWVKDCIVAKGLKHGWRSSFWRESRSYQDDWLRRATSLAIQYLLPAKMADAIFRFGAKKYARKNS
jgi:hypothetical protein